ncbi:PTS sugar transporter subunit IIA [Okibacterium fritillariae]|jgi:PTS system mannitol-specific IIA component|uniref:Mannitol-specific phosphotransferase enzyme IIA component n=1 Tax=Okibacterium fritillariae TaxID=123320 RepID=A0A1T5K7C7_9MICO|nr:MULTISPECIES: PTS sugar transporter subunit IIA [Microbacteriaceae]ONI61429.1 PTS mannitol transporter subunit IIA [Leifsonia sp. ALI-44-B]SKC59534.1 PTS system D-mannitol-specific IIA component, Fru family [Okibacterium fritillariae]
MSEQILAADQIEIVSDAVTKEQAIRRAADILERVGAVSDGYYAAMLQREETVSTYMGNFLAIPHGTNDAKDTITRSALSFTRYEQPIDWAGEEVRFVVGIAGVNNEHLDILSRIAIIFSDEDEVAKLADASTTDEIFALLGDVNAE